MPITKTVNFLPAVFQSDANQKFLNATLDQLVTEPNLKPISGYVGRKFAPGFKDVTSYLREPTQDRADYQLEPSVVVKNSLQTAVDFHATYPEILQKIAYNGGNTTDQSRLWSNEFYSYDPKINPDAFINFGQYYWLPNGPDAVDVFTNVVQTEKTFYIYPNDGDGVYNISGYGSVFNPDIVLAHGGTYKFIVDQPGKPFWIQTDPGTSGYQIKNNNISSRQILGVTNNGTDVGTITFNVPDITAQDLFISMPTVQAVDFATTSRFVDIQNKSLALISASIFDGQIDNLANKYVIFAKKYEDDLDWQAGGLFDSSIDAGFDAVPFDYGLTVDPAQRYGIWQIKLIPDDIGGYFVNLIYVTSIPLNNKVRISGGVTYGNTEWYTDTDGYLSEVPVLTASLPTLYYQDGVVSGEVGILKIVNASSNTIDIDNEIIGREYYISPNGVTFSNGLKVRFDESATPAKYQNNEYYVDGVGSAITLTAVTSLTINFAGSRSNYDPSAHFVSLANATLNSAKDQLTITTTDFPSGQDIFKGTFPNQANKNYVVSQDLVLTYPYSGSLDTQGDHTTIALESGTIGITLPGVVINGVSNGWYVTGDSGSTWHYDSNQVLINGRDNYGGYPTEDGKYSYRDSTFITANAWGNVTGFTTGYLNTDGHSKLIGFAADGYPIYGPYGYLNPLDATTSAVRMTSSYSASTGQFNRPSSATVTLSANVTVDANGFANAIVSSTFGLNPGMRVTTNSAGIARQSAWIVNNGLHTAVGPAEFTGGTNQIQLTNLPANTTYYAGASMTFEFLAGAFIEDYTYHPGSGSLDQYNGRYCVTPEFPAGTYAYFATVDTSLKPVYPYLIGTSYYGSLQVNSNTSLTTPDYIVINRASRDLNPWSRHNRWFHKNIIQVTDLYNNSTTVLDQNYRASRPIIEFIPNLQLFDFGVNGLAPVDLFDTTIASPFTSVEGVAGLYIDQVNVVEGMRIIFAADQDPGTRGKIWTVNFFDMTGISDSDTKVIHLTLAADGNVAPGDTVSVFNGVANAGKSFWYNGIAWGEGQVKSSQNQQPKFDVFDIDGVSLGDKIKYPISNKFLSFQGTNIFGYKVGTGVADTVLGFPLSYKNFNNVGDIQFTNNFDTDKFLYTIDKVDYTNNVNTGYLYRNNLDGTVTKLNVWEKVTEQSKQYQDISYIYDGINNGFTLDVVPAVNVTIPNLLVYVDYKLIPTTDYQIYNLPQNQKSIVIKANKLTNGSKVDILVYSNQTSKLGYYEIPSNLNFNAQNTVISSPTLGELRNHISELTQNSLNFAGTYPGVSNLRDIQITANGGTMLQHSAPTTFATMFLIDDQLNFINSIQNAQHEYTRFKNKFLNIAETNRNIDYNDPVASVDLIIKQINQVKNKTFSWYYSDMIPYGDNKNVITYTVFNTYLRNYEITSIFDNTVLSNKAILVYLNGTQLIYNQDYTFLKTAPGITMSDSVTLNIDDIITIVEYHDTDGSWIPETPTKLGLYPKFTPEIYTDYTYLIPQTMIKGHDGSLTPSFGDFRDQFLLELEKRIYNNIKVAYDEKSFSIYDSKPGKFRNIGYTLSEVNTILSKTYLPWIGLNRLDYTTNSTFNDVNPFTYNYGTAFDIVDGQPLPGSWRACFEYFYDTQRPNTNPWEMLGFSEMPTWWESTYGPAPYTSGNKILWTDLENGYIAGGDRMGIDSRFARPGLMNFIPVNENGQLVPPIGNLTVKYYSPDFMRPWRVGQMSPTETAWRNSSEYAFAAQVVAAIAQPAKYFALGIANNKYRYNTDIKQYLVTGTNYRLTQADIDVNGYVAADGTISRASGYLNWIGDYLNSLGLLTKDKLLHYVRDYTVQLSYRMAGFSDKRYLKVLAEQNSPNSINESVIIPDSDIDLILNKSTPVTNARYSAIIVERDIDGYKISGYDTSNPYFLSIPPAKTGKAHGLTVLNQSVDYYTEFTNYKISVPYGTVFATLQQLISFIAGYERNLLAQGFRFDTYDQDLGKIKNWQLSAEEILFWSQQGWSVGSMIVVGPVGSTIKLNNPSAVVDEISNSFYGTRVVTQNFETLQSDGYNVLRDNNQFRLNLENSSGNMIAFASLNLVQYEHLLIFNNKTQFNDIIYDPSLGQRQFRLKLVGSKTQGWSGTFAPQGFVYNQPGVPTWHSNTDYMKGDLIEQKNFYYAARKDIPGTPEFNVSDWLPVDKKTVKTGLLNNMATNAGIGAKFYETDGINLENQFDTYGLALIGYKNRNYLTDLELDDTSQVKFYQGFIRQKGTKNAIDALGHSGIDAQTNKVDINEEWAFRVGSYGSIDTNQYVELVLPESYTLNNPTSLEVTSNNSVIYSSIYSSATGVYKSASTNWSAPFLLNRTNNSFRSDDIQTAGFVNIEDVNYTVFDLSNTSSLSANISTIGAGSTIWTTKDYSLNWNVFRVSDSGTQVITIANALNNNILVTTKDLHDLSVNDTVMIKSADKFTGFYRVKTIQSLTSFIVEYNGPMTNQAAKSYTSPLYKLVSLRYDRASNITNFTPVGGWKANSKAWVNFDTTSNTWAVYNKTEPWQIHTTLPKAAFTANGQFGTSVKLSADNNFAVVGEPGYNSGVGAITNYILAFNGELSEDTRSLTVAAANTRSLGYSIDSGFGNVVAGAPNSASGIGYAFVYKRSFQGALSLKQILAPNTANAIAFGTSISMSEDDQWLYVGAPSSDSVYAYGYDNSVTSSTDTLTSNGVATSFSLVFTPSSTELLRVEGTNKDYVPFIDFTVSGSVLTFKSAPATDRIVVRQNPGYRFVTKLTGNSGSNFGYSIATSTGGTQLVIGSPNASVTSGNVVLSQSGQITVYDRSIEKFIAIANQTSFTVNRTLLNFGKVYVNDTLKVKDVDYRVVGSSTVIFNTGLTASNIVTIESDNFIKIQDIVPTTPLSKIKFGYSVDLCPNNCSVYAGAPYTSTENYYVGSVYRLLNQGRIYGSIQGTIQNPTVASGSSIKINNFEVIFTDITLTSVIATINAAGIPGITASNLNNYLYITSDSTLSADKLRILPGAGSALTSLGLNVFVQTEIIKNPNNKAYDYFGQVVKINTNSSVLAIGSPDATTIEFATFDLEETTFDAGSIVFKDAVVAGSVWILNYLNDSRNSIQYPGNFIFGQQLTTKNIALPIPMKANVRFGSSIDLIGNELLVGLPYDNNVEAGGGAVYQFNNSTGLLGWDVYRSEEPKVDIDSIRKIYIYSASSQTILNNLDYIDPAKGKIIGRAEQDITYKTDYDPAIYNHATNPSVSLDTNFYWNTTQVGQVWWDLSTVKYLDYEQGSIKYRTSNWGRMFPNSSIDVYEWVESLYPPSQYVSQGGDGVPKNADNSAYVTLTYVDPTSNTAIVKYYFWVKDKTTVTANQYGREIPTVTIADYIQNPINSGVKYAAALRDDSFAVYNVIGNTTGNDVILHIDYNTQLNQNIIHSEYALLSETNTKSSSIPTTIYNKLVDSVSGIDLIGNQVPDSRLPVQQRYGIDIRPRQSMFIDRNQAINEMVTYVNNVFAQNIISQGYDLSKLSESEAIPASGSGVYDTTVPNLEVLGFINTSIYNTGYKVLVLNDANVSNMWTIYTLQADKSWFLSRVQTYRTTDYWEYIDWYAPGFDSSVKPRFTVNTQADLANIPVKSGDIVKILNNGQGKWLLVQVYTNFVATVGIQSGTIALTENLYNLAAYGMGFGNDNFDSNRFDQNPSIEIRNILAALRDNIFINQLSENFVSLFFVFIYYVLNEQKYIDWAFKTSFIDVIQKLKALNQPPIYRKDNQDFYKQYIDEVKPYHTTVREYVLDYAVSDNVDGYVLDFDVPAYYDSVLGTYRSPSGEFLQDAAALEQLQYRDWLLNYSYEVDTIDVITGGTGYTIAPTVIITGSSIGNDAVARALITDGRVSRIQVLYRGTNYTTQPTITLDGGNGTGARAYARLTNNKVRSLKTILVYDRLTYSTVVAKWTANTVFAQGSIVAHNGTAYIVNRTFTSGASFVGNDLTIYPATKLTAANDRIQSYYSPEQGQPGADFSLLQSGINYPGVTVEGPLYSDAGGFDVGAFDQAPLDALTLDTDGTYIISDTLLDSKITSSYTDTLIGTRPEDIIIDGGEYVDTYSSHAPEELIPGRIFDTLDMTVYTFKAYTGGAAYASWANTSAFFVANIVVNNGGLGYSYPTIVIDTDGEFGSNATANAVIDANGTITAINVIGSGSGYTTMPNVIITGTNTSPASASVRLAPNPIIGVPVTTFQYRIFKDMVDTVSYLRVSDRYTTTLVSNLSLTDSVITVANTQLLPTPNTSTATPGVIFIDGERITYYQKFDSNNTLGQIRRGTGGTGARTHTIGTQVIDASLSQVVPQSVDYQWQATANAVLQTTSLGGYTVVAGNTYTRGNLWYGIGTLPIEISTEIYANLSSDFIITQNNVSITTEGGGGPGATSATDGTGLYNSNTLQVLFITDQI